MSYAIILSFHAEKEIDNSFNWYEDRLPGLGIRFLEFVEKSILQLSLQPEFYPNKKGKYREVPVEKFPYLIIYEVLKKQKTVHVLHVFNTNQNPKSKYKK